MAGRINFLILLQDKTGIQTNIQYEHSDEILIFWMKLQKLNDWDFKISAKSKK